MVMKLFSPLSRNWHVLLLAVLAFHSTLPTSAWAQDNPFESSTAAPKFKVPKWDELKALHDYEKTPQGKPLTVTEKAQGEETFEGKPLSLTHLTFTNGKGKKVTGLYLRPKAEGVYPVALLLHGLGSDKETMIRYFGRYLAARGVACLALDAAGHGERRDPEEARGGGRLVGVIRDTIAEYRLMLDWLATRKEADAKKIGAFGYSMGAIMLSILGGVDDRIQAGMFCVGGDPVVSSVDALPPALRSPVIAASPSLYIPYFSPRPALFINASKDRIMNRASADRLLNAAKEPKTVWWVEGGHILPQADAQRGMDWLMTQLGIKIPVSASGISQ